MKRRLVISVLLVLVVILIGGMVKLTNAAACPNAVSIARDYLTKTYAIGPGSDLWSGVISSVGQESGSDGELWAAESCQPGFADRVISFVEGQLPR